MIVLSVNCPIFEGNILLTVNMLLLVGTTLIYFSFRAVSSLRRLAHTHNNMPVIWVVCRRKFNLLVLFDVVLSIIPSPKMYGPCASRLLLNLLKDFIPTL